MARITLAAQALRDLDRILDFLIEHDAADAGERVADIVVALDVLTRNPLIGRPVEAPFASLSSAADRAGTWLCIDMRPTTMPCLSSVFEASARRDFSSV